MSSPDIDRLLTQMQVEFVNKQQSGSNSAEDLLTSVEREFQQKKITPLSSLDNVETIRNQELEKQRRATLLTRQAEKWLKNLEPLSDEGLWFERFSRDYESKLAAAIDYLQSLG